MHLEFKGSPQPTIGVEIELQLVDPETLDLTPRAKELLLICQQKGVERVKAEIHQSMVEVNSEIAFQVDECAVV